jgi:hypothetical protein
MSPLRSGSDRRAFPRHRVRVLVQWSKRSADVMAGEICDVSLQGVFLVSRTALPDDVGVGVRTRITVRTDAGEDDLLGTVKWRGYHPSYEAIGCGILIDEASRPALIKLFPVLRDSA